MEEITAIFRQDPKLGIGLGAIVVLIILLKVKNIGPKFGSNTKVDKTLKKFLDAHNYEGAANYELKNNRQQSAYDLFIRAQRPAKAATVAAKMGWTKEAADLYERADELDRALDLYRLLGDKNKVTEIEARKERKEKGIKEGAPEPPRPKLDPNAPDYKAKQLEQEFLDKKKAAQMSGDGDTRAAMEQAGRQAAEAFLGLGEMRKSAEILRDAGLTEQAVSMFVNLVGDSAAAADALGSKGEHKRAAELYDLAGQKDKALLAWLDWSDGAEDPLAHLADVDKLGDHAVPRLLEIVRQRRPLEKTDPRMDLHHRMAAAYMDRGKHRDAVPLLEKLLALDPQYRDIGARLTEARKKAAEAPRPKQAPPGFGGAGVPMPQPAIPLATAPTLHLDFSAPETAAAAGVAPIGQSLNFGGGDLGLAQTPSFDPGAFSFDDKPKAAPAGAAPAAPLSLENSEVIRLVKDAAAAAAAQALTHAAITAATVAAATNIRRTLARGLEKIDLALEYSQDPAVIAAKAGPSVEDLKGMVGSKKATLANIEVYYRLGLALIAAGRWEEAGQAFASVEEVSPGYRDAGHRAEEVNRWKGAIGGTQLKLSKAGGGSARYTLIGELGRGGMAVVYRAKDEALGREVALKFMAEGMGEDPTMLGMFQREAQAVAKLTHPNIITIYDVGVQDGRPFICMELVDGATIADQIEREGALSVLDAVTITEQVLMALEYAHSKKIIHRDIKPANVMRTKDGFVKMMDFGLARQSDSNKTTMIAGSPPYMPPEQLEGKNMDARTDLFALGVTLYEMLTTKMPFEGMARNGPPESPRNLNPAIPKVLDAAIMRALSLPRDARFASATEMLEPLRAVLQAAGRKTLVKHKDEVVPAIEPPKPAEAPSLADLFGDLAPEPEPEPFPDLDDLFAEEPATAPTELAMPPPKIEPRATEPRATEPRATMMGRAQTPPMGILEPEPESTARSSSTMMGMTGLAPPVETKPPATKPKPPGNKPTIAGVPPAPIALQHLAEENDPDKRPTDKVALPEPETANVGTYRLTRKSLNARDEVPGGKRKP